MSIWIDKAGRRHVGVMQDGRRLHRVLPKGASASDAKRIESGLRTAIGQRGVAIPGDPYLAQCMHLYLVHAKRLRSPQTAIHHALRIGRWLEGYRASQTRMAVASINADMAGHYAQGTINRSLGALKKALKLAWESGATPVDYSSTVKRGPENNQRTTYLDLAQVKQLAGCASEAVAAVIWIAVLTGCRRGELCKIKADDIGQDTIRIQAGNTKTLKVRDVPITRALRPWLKHLPLAIGAEGIKTGFGRAREKAGMPDVNFHDLRHSCATILLASGADLYTISKVLGHTSIKSTERYSHMQIERQRDALEKAFG